MYDMNKILSDAEKAFVDHEVNIVLKNELITVIDYMNKNHTIDHYLRISMFHDSGTVLITGDLGDCVARWYRPTSLEQFIGYFDPWNIEYFVSKFTTSTVKYTYNDEDIETDLNDMKANIQRDIDEGDYEIDDLDEKIDELTHILTDQPNNLLESLNITPDAAELFGELLGDDWWDSSYVHAGQRYHPIIYKWAVAFQNIGKVLGAVKE